MEFSWLPLFFLPFLNFYSLTLSFFPLPHSARYLTNYDMQTQNEICVKRHSTENSPGSKLQMTFQSREYWLCSTFNLV